MVDKIVFVLEKLTKKVNRPAQHTAHVKFLCGPREVSKHVALMFEILVARMVDLQIETTSSSICNRHCVTELLKLQILQRRRKKRPSNFFRGQSM